jgi:hypothetical protein
MTQGRTFVARRRTLGVLVRDAAAAPTQTPAHTNAKQSGKDWLHGRVPRVNMSNHGEACARADIGNRLCSPLRTSDGILHT